MMSKNKDYATLSLDELLAEEKKIKQKGIISAVLIGISIGIMIYGIAKNGFGFLHIFLPSLLIYGIYRGSQPLKQELKQVQAEIKGKNSV